MTPTKTIRADLFAEITKAIADNKDVRFVLVNTACNPLEVICTQKNKMDCILSHIESGEITSWKIYTKYFNRRVGN